MSMTENEVLISRSTLLDSFRKCYSGHMGMENSDNMMMFKSICRIINDQEAIGTVEDWQKLIEKEATERRKLEEYFMLGSVEEFKALKEKKSEWKHSRKEDIATCKNCSYEHYLGTYHQYATNYCPRCGCEMKT